MALTRLFWVRLIVLSLGLAVVLYMVAIPVASMMLERAAPKPSISRIETDLTPAELLRVKSAEAVTAFWFFALGASLGSFLNVIAYRWPRGRSVVLQRSRCPDCGSAIRGKDNVPILGWLFLGGRCRVCQAAIPIGYIAAEIILGLIFLLLFFVELTSGGANLPVRHPNLHAGVLWTVFYTKWDLISIYLYHGMLFGWLLVLSLIPDRGPTLRWYHSLGITGLMIAPPWALPWLLMVRYPSPDTAVWVTLAISGAIGGLLFFATGLLSCVPTRNSLPGMILPGWIMGGIWISLALGHQGGLRVVSIALLILLIGAPWSWVTFSRALLIAAVIHHPLWRIAHQNAPLWLPGTPAGTSSWIVIQALVLIALALLVRCARTVVCRLTRVVVVDQPSLASGEVNNRADDGDHDQNDAVHGRDDQA